MPLITPIQDEALRHFLGRIRADFAESVREVRLLADRPAPGNESHADLGLLVLIGLSADQARDVDHSLDNVACEVSLLHETLLELRFSHDGEARDAETWGEPASRRLYP